MELYTKTKQVESFTFSHTSPWPEWFKEALLSGVVVIKSSTTGLAKAAIYVNGTRYVVNEGDIILRDQGAIFALTREQVQDSYVDINGKVPVMELTIGRNVVTPSEVAK